MSVAVDPADPPAKKGLKLPLLLGLLLALVGGGAGFTVMRLLGQPATDAQAHDAVADDHGEPVATAGYVPLDPLVVNLPRATGRQYLRFGATLEVEPAHLAEVETLRPRVADVLNTYLRAVEPADFEDQMILAELRSQLLRRIQVVTGAGRVRDLLITEFVLD